MPFFFSNPFASAKIAEEDSENISIYTTSSPSTSENDTVRSPSVYLRLVKGVYDGFRSPFGQTFAGQQTSKIVSTTMKSETTESALEMLDDSSDFNNSTELDSQERKEDLDPHLIETNPSFKIKPISDGRRPERIVLSSDLEKENIETPDSKENEIEDRADSEESDEEEDDDLNKDSDKAVTDNGSNRLTENGFVFILEYVASAFTLAWGAINSIFQPKAS